MYRTQIDIYPYTYIFNAYTSYATVYCMISIYNMRYIHPYINIYTYNIHTIYIHTIYVCMYQRIRMCLYLSVYIQLLYNEIAKLMKMKMKMKTNIKRKWKKTRKNKIKQKAKTNAYFLEHVWAKNPMKNNQSKQKKRNRQLKNEGNEWNQTKLVFKKWLIKKKTKHYERLNHHLFWHYQRRLFRFFFNLIFE